MFDFTGIFTRVEFHTVSFPSYKELYIVTFFQISFYYPSRTQGPHYKFSGHNYYVAYYLCPTGLSNLYLALLMFQVASISLSMDLSQKVSFAFCILDLYVLCSLLFLIAEIQKKGNLYSRLQNIEMFLFEAQIPLLNCKDFFCENKGKRH